MPHSHTLSKLLIVGGTFCPPHQAHLAIVSAVTKHFAFDNVMFVPCKEPVIDKIAATPVSHRIAMLRLALKPYPNFTIDLCEIDRDSPSYMVTTLADFRQRFGDQVSITLLIGMDNFLQLPRWHRWEDLLTLCHLLVVDRAGIPRELSPTLRTFLAKHHATTTHNLSTTPYGTIEQYDAGQYDISSTAIRAMIQAAIMSGANTDAIIAPEVREYIKEHQLFLKSSWT